MSPLERMKRQRQSNLTKLNKRLRKQMRITPWKDIWELESVGRGLLSILDYSSSNPESATQVVQALETVTVWKARSEALEALPHAVESTAHLVQVYLRDQIQQNRNSTSTYFGGAISVTELRHAYSSAIVRCINGYADALQQQRFAAAPVSSLCGQLGIPSWLVDIRHEASHNALPTLPVLRLAAVTLLEYLQTEYWIPTCMPQSKDDAEGNSKSQQDKSDKLVAPTRPRPIDLLVQYKTHASKSSSPDNSINNESTKGSSSPKQAGAPRDRPFDTFFGDSSDDDSSGDEWVDPLLGSLWGTTVGTNSNRFAALEPPKKVKPPPPKPKKPKRKKQPGEKSATDYVKEFVKTVSPQEGFSTAIQFLVWGGIGGAPTGRGVLIPGSAVAFPATSQGIRKSWQRYLPLLEILCHAWPGFSAALLVHMVDFVLTIEAECISNNRTGDVGSARKLYFLSAWIRFLVSEQFVHKLFPELKPTTTSTTTNSKSKRPNSTTAEIPLATYEQLQPLLYPLNSLCDRCCCNDDHAEMRKTSRGVKDCLEEILGSKRVENYGISTPSFAAVKESAVQSPIGHGPALSDGKMSLDDMEALLSDSDEEKEATTATVPVVSKIDEESIMAEEPLPTSSDRPNNPWTRCSSWDECAIGALPGQPV